MPSVAQTTGRERVIPTAEIRRHFPALERCQAGSPVAYFDGPGGTQVPRAVVDAMSDYLYHHNANTHWEYPTSRETDRAIDSARRTFGAFLGAEAAEIIFGANMTTLTFHVARALGRNYGPGDEIVVTELDHHANVAPWTALRDERGVRVRTIRMRAEGGQIEWEDLVRSLSNRTKLLAIGGASNALGTINDLPRAVAAAHEVGALIFVDGVHLAPHVMVDVHALDCDFFACSAYKFYGPHVGILYGKHDLLQALNFPRLLPASNEPPERGETGTLNHEGIIGAAAAVDWLASCVPGDSRRGRLLAVYDEFHARNAELTTALWEGLAGIAGVTLFGPTPDAARTPTVAFTVSGRGSHDVSRQLAECGIFASHGDFYAATVVERLGLDCTGLVRAGCACYTTREEVERLVIAVGELAG